MPRNHVALTVSGHLSELRSRVVRSMIYVALGTVAGWIYYGACFRLIGGPVSHFLMRTGGKFLVTGPIEGFTLKMQVSLLVGLIVSLPLTTCEGWGFIRPGLSGPERKMLLFVAPLSLLLFASGVAMTYLVLPFGVEWLAAQNPPGSTFMPALGQSVLFILKMALAFGLVFQMPVVLMFLGRLGIIDARVMKARWREAVLALVIITATATPSNDFLSITLMCLPVLLLYALSIELVAWSGRRRQRDR